MKVGENNLVALLDQKTIVTIIPQELVMVILSIYSLSDLSFLLFMKTLFILPSNSFLAVGKILSLSTR